jgi:hypothetical protein
MPTGKWTTPYGVNEPYALSGLRSVTNIPNTSLNPSPPGSGTVTSVGLSLPAELTVSGSPVTTSGTLAGSWASQLQNLVLASPNGSSGVPTFRALVAADIPSLPYTPTTLTSAHILVGNGSNVATDVAASGDLTLANTGAFTIANNAVTTAKINNAAVTLAKIANASANSILLGSGASGSGSSYAEITLGTNLSMSGTTLNAAGSSSPLTTKGDIYTHSTVDARLPVGTNDYVLTPDSAQTTGLKWQSLSAQIDAAIGSTQGNILYRGASTWSVLAPGAQYQVLMCGGAGANPSWQTVSAIGVFYKTGLTPPVTGNFSTFSGGGTFSATDKSDRLQLAHLGTGSNVLSGITKNLAYSPPYTIDICIVLATGSSTFLSGIQLSDGTKFRTLFVGYASSTVQLDIQQWATSSSVPSTVQSIASGWFPGLGVFFLRITDDNTNRKYYVSFDGKGFMQILSEVNTSGFTATKVGICIENISATWNGLSSAYHFLETNSVLGDAA